MSREVPDLAPFRLLREVTPRPLGGAGKRRVFLCRHASADGEWEVRWLSGAPPDADPAAGIAGLARRMVVAKESGFLWAERRGAGGSLSERLSLSGPLPWAAGRWILFQVCEALESAMAAGLGVEPPGPDTVDFAGAWPDLEVSLRGLRPEKPAHDFRPLSVDLVRLALAIHPGGVPPSEDLEVSLRRDGVDPEAAKLLLGMLRSPPESPARWIDELARGVIQAAPALETLPAAASAGMSSGLARSPRPERPAPAAPATAETGVEVLSANPAAQIVSPSRPARTTRRTAILAVSAALGVSVAFLLYRTFSGDGREPTGAERVATQPPGPGSVEDGTGDAKPREEESHSPEETALRRSEKAERIAREKEVEKARKAEIARLKKEADERREREEAAVREAREKIEAEKRKREEVAALGQLLENPEADENARIDAFRRCLELAKQGDAEAAMFAGAALWQGFGVDQDRGAAVEWFEQSARAGVSRGMLGLGTAYMLGDGVNKDREKAIEWLEKAAATEPLAMTRLGTLYAEENDFEMAAEWWAKAAAEKVPAALTNLGILHIQGKGVSEDLEKALTLLTKAHESGEIRATTELGYLYYNQRVSGSGDRKRAFDYFTKGADAGDARALTGLGVCLYYGHGTGIDKEAALDCFSRAAEKDDRQAIEILKKLKPDDDE